MEVALAEPAHSTVLSRRQALAFAAGAVVATAIPAIGEKPMMTAAEYVGLMREAGNLFTLEGARVYIGNPDGLDYPGGDFDDRLKVWADHAKKAG